jgi:hypothetical protein
MKDISFFVTRQLFEKSHLFFSASPYSARHLQKPPFPPLKKGGGGGI